MAKHIVDCPVRNEEYDCSRCEFYDVVPASTEEGKELAYKCRHELTNIMLNDIHAILNVLLQSEEHHRVTFTEMVQANYTGQPSESLLKKIGIERTPEGYKQLPPQG